MQSVCVVLLFRMRVNVRRLISPQHVKTLAPDLVNAAALVKGRRRKSDQSVSAEVGGLPRNATSSKCANYIGLLVYFLAFFSLSALQVFWSRLVFGKQQLHTISQHDLNKSVNLHSSNLFKTWLSIAIKFSSRHPPQKIKICMVPTHI